MRRLLYRDHSGNSRTALIDDGKVVIDWSTDKIRIGDGKTVGGIELDVHGPLTTEQFIRLLLAVGIWPGLPHDRAGNSASCILSDSEIVMDRSTLRIGDGKTLGGIAIPAPRSEDGGQ